MNERCVRTPPSARKTAIREMAERAADTERLLYRLRNRAADAWADGDTETLDRIWRAATRLERREQERERAKEEPR